MLKRVVKRTLASLGYTISRTAPLSAELPPDMDPAFLAIYANCREFTMTYIERMYALHKAVKYVAAHAVPGAIVECGVWRGGSMMNAAFTLLAMGSADRDLYLYDTFEGMSEPSSPDVDYLGNAAIQRWEAGASPGYNEWCYAPLEEVKQNLSSTRYPPERLVFVKGRVEDTIPKVAPPSIAILRLDTDWYDSTYHELQHLFPRLSRGGVLILDDYGHWRGHRQAVDRYLQEHHIPILLNRVDYCGAMGVKL
jgi:O-methyltransferase